MQPIFALPLTVAPAQAETLLNPWFFHVSTVDDLCWCRRYAKESFKSPPIPVPRGVPLAPCCLRHGKTPPPPPLYRSRRHHKGKWVCLCLNPSF